MCELFRVFGILSLERRLYVVAAEMSDFDISKLSAWFNGTMDRLKINMPLYNLGEPSSLQRPGLQG